MMLIQACCVRLFPTLSADYKKHYSGVKSDDGTNGTMTMVPSRQFWPVLDGLGVNGLS